MKRALAAVMVVAMASGSGCLLSPVIPIGGGKSAKQNQRAGLDKQVPTQLEATATWKGDVRVARIRVWADDEYRAQNVQWQHAFDDQIDSVNQVLAPMLGVRLEAEYRSWDRHAPGIPLSDGLDALAQQDPGEDVVWVLGLTSSLSLVSATFDELGVAHMGGRHLVVRGYADLEERRSFERAFPKLSAQDREAVLDARRRHKTTALLLHELAHSLGAPHERGADRLLSPAYSHRAAAISAGNRELMSITLDDRLKPAADRDPRTTARRLLAVLEADGDDWSADERAEQIEHLRAQAGSAAPVGVAGPVPAAILDQYRHAEELLDGGNPSGARATLEPLLAAYPAHAQLRVLDCRIELARGGAKDRKAIATCERAAALSADVEPAIAVAAARLGAGDADGARATLVATEARLAGLPPDKAGAAWLVLAEQYRGLGAVTWAELAVARSGAAANADRGIAAWAATTRVRFGIPRDGARYKLTPADDAAAVTAVRNTISLVNASKFDAAAKAVRAAEQRWPQLPGLLAARCDLELRRGALATARQLCARASAGSSWALYLSGVIELRDPSAAATAAGIRRLRQAIDADPELGQAWRTLGKALQRARATTELDQLRRDYLARFHTALL